MNKLRHIIVLFLIIPVFPNAFADNLFLQGKTLSDSFSPGTGPSVGYIQILENNVFLVHHRENTAYLAKDDLPVFVLDTIATGYNGACQVRFKDGSLMSIAKNTNLTLTNAVYKPSKKIRYSAVYLLGRVRFVVRKMTGFRHSDFNVKTKTAILGVRGSDFVVEAHDEHTVVYALDDTALAVWSSDFPKEKPVIVGSRQSTHVEENARPSDVSDIPDEKIEALKSEFDISKRERTAESKRVFFRDLQVGMTEQTTTDTVSPETMTGVGTSETEIELALPDDPPTSPTGHSDSVSDGTAARDGFLNIEDMADAITEDHAAGQLANQTETPWFPGKP